MRIQRLVYCVKPTKSNQSLCEWETATVVLFVAAEARQDGIQRAREHLRSQHWQVIRLLLHDSLSEPLVIDQGGDVLNAYPLHMGSSIASLKRDHSYSKRSTDRVVFSFGSDFEPLIEFGSNAIARMVNDRNIELLRQSISYLDKSKQKIIREDFNTLIRNDVRCVPLRPSTVEIGYRLLEAFQLSGEKFKTTFRNGWNDLLILAAAWDHNDELWSRDSQLNRFAASAFGECRESIQGLLKIRLHSATREVKQHGNGEPQSYVNKGWRATFKTGRNPAW
jgi:hypothetical protein